MSLYTEQGTWKACPITDEQIEDMKRGACTMPLGGGLSGIGMWELIGVFARLEAAEALIAGLFSADVTIDQCEVLRQCWEKAKGE